MGAVLDFRSNLEMMIHNVAGTQIDGRSWGSDGGGGGDGSEAGLKKGPWTAEEDAVLMEYVRKHGEGNWNRVEMNSGLNRCGKSCRLRWANHLRPNLKKCAISPEEERLIAELHAKLGNKWSRMAAQLPGRTDNEIKNYWNTRAKRRKRRGLPLYPDDIHPLSVPTTPTAAVPTTPSDVPNPLQLSSSSSFHHPSLIIEPPFRFDPFPLPQNSNSDLIHSPPSLYPQIPSFYFSPHLTANSTEILNTQFETQNFPMSDSMTLVNSELPSNQIIIEVPPGNHCELMDDLLATSEDTSMETQCLMSREEETLFDGFSKIKDLDPPHFVPGETRKEEAGDELSLGYYDWLKLLGGMPPAMPVKEGVTTSGRSRMYILSMKNWESDKDELHPFSIGNGISCRARTAI